MSREFSSFKLKCLGFLSCLALFTDSFFPLFKGSHAQPKKLTSGIKIIFKIAKTKYMENPIMSKQVCHKIWSHFSEVQSPIATTKSLGISYFLAHFAALGCKTQSPFSSCFSLPFPGLLDWATLFIVPSHGTMAFSMVDRLIRFEDSHLFAQFFN